MEALTESEIIERAALHLFGMPPDPGLRHVALRGLGIPPAQAARLLPKIERRTTQLEAQVYRHAEH